MENVSVGQYRTHDQPKNFSIKVTFSKVTPANIIPSAQLRSFEINGDHSNTSLELVNCKKDEADEREEVVIQWQEKLFSEREFEAYQDSMNCTTSLQMKYHEDVHEMLKKFGGRLNKRIFTYVDNDSLTSVENISSVTTPPYVNETSLAQKMNNLKLLNMKKPFPNASGLRKRRNIVNFAPSDNFKTDHVITTPHKTMKIMIDLGFVDVNEITVHDERLLCEIQLDANGSLISKPDLDDSEVHTLETNYGVRCVYQYTLKHVSSKMNTEEQEQEIRLINELYARHQQLMASQVGHEFYPIVQSNELYVYSFVEIECARNFEYDNLYVQYVLELPDGWICFNDHRLSGITHSCSMNKDSVAHFSFPLEFDLSFQWNEGEGVDFMKWPILYLQVYSLDTWQRHRIEGYGYCQIPDVAGATRVQVNMWRPKGDSMMSEVQRYFIGGTPELVEPSYVREASNNQSNQKLNKFYFKTVTTGNVILKLNTLFQNRVSDDTHGVAPNVNSKWRKVYSRKTGAFAAALDPLTHVFDAFQKARKRMLAARSTLPLTT